MRTGPPPARRTIGSVPRAGRMRTGGPGGPASSFAFIRRAIMCRIFCIPAVPIALAVLAPKLAAAETHPAGPGDGVLAAQTNPYDIPLNTDVLPFMLLLVAAAACVGVMLMVRGARRTCPHCRVPVRRLDGEAAAACLDVGQRREQAVGSMRYTVWTCPTCGNREIVSQPRRNRRDPCPECGFHTLRVDRETLQSPTDAEEGVRRVEMDCDHCGWHHEAMLALPRARPGSGVALLKVLHVAAQAASLLNTIDSVRDRAGRSSRGDSDDEAGSGRGSSGHW
jgi:predicted RNA-binding Zn-ribbon protein involved in translation (DUF1610 family)